MKTLELAATGDLLSGHVRQAGQEPLILTDHGTPVAAVISLEGMDAETLSLSTNPRFQAIIERSRARREAEGGISHEDLLRQLGMDGDSMADTAGPSRDDD